MTEKGLEYWGRVKERIPDLDLWNRRDLTGDMFVTVGRTLYEISNELYLTSHVPDLYCNPQTSYELWIGKPVILESGYPRWYNNRKGGHPDWDYNRDIAVAEMWKVGISPIAAEGLCQKIVPTGQEIVYSVYGKKIRNRRTDDWSWIDDLRSFHNETRIYNLKERK